MVINGVFQKSSYFYNFDLSSPYLFSTFWKKILSIFHKNKLLFVATDYL